MKKAWRASAVAVAVLAPAELWTGASGAAPVAAPASQPATQTAMPDRLDLPAWLRGPALPDDPMLVEKELLGPYHSRHFDERYYHPGHLIYSIQFGQTETSPGVRGAPIQVVHNGRVGPRYDRLRWPIAVLGEQVAYAGRYGGRASVVHDDRQGKSYDAVYDLTLAPDGRWAYTAREGEKEFLVLDGNESKPYDGIWSQPVFSADGRHVAFLAQFGKAFRLVVDGREGPEHPAVANRPPVASADGRRWAYVIVRGGRQAVVCDGKVGPFFEWIGPIQFAPDGRVLYAACDDEDSNRYSLTRVVVEGVAMKERWDRMERVLLASGGGMHGGADPTPGAFRFAPDGQRWWCVAWKEEKLAIIVNGRVVRDGYDRPPRVCAGPGGAFAYGGTIGGKPELIVNGRKVPHGPGSLQFSPDGMHYACACFDRNRPDPKYTVYRDGKVDLRCNDANTSFLFSPDSRRLAYPAEVGKAWHMICDGKAGPGFPSMLCGYVNPFMAGSRHLVYHGMIGDDYRLVIDDWQGPEGLSIDCRGISPDGKHSLIRVRAGARRMIFLDGAAVQECTGVGGAAWSADSRRVAYALKHQGQEWVTVNRTPGPRGQRVLWGSSLEFAPDGSLTYLLVADEKVWRIRHRPKAPAASGEGGKP